MPKRLNQNRQDELEPYRIETTKFALQELGAKNLRMIDYGAGFRFNFLDLEVRFWPYSGWWSGSKIGSGRGFRKLLQILEKLSKGDGQ